MSTQVTTAFVQQYNANVQMLAQQKGSKLHGSVRVESVTGTNAYYDQIGATGARLRTTRHSDTPQMDTPHSRRRLDLLDYDWADLIDTADKVRMLIDPTSSYAQAAAMAMGRAMDAAIVDAILGSALTGVAGGTTTVFDSAQSIAVGATGLTIAKLRTAKELLDLNDIDPDGRHIAATAKQFTTLLATTEITSSDYNTVKALVKGEVDTFLGFQFHNVNGLRADGTLILPLDGSGDRRCIAWQQDNVVLGIGQDAVAKISERADKNYSMQVFNSMSIGATRLQEKAVVEIIADL